MPIRDEDDDGPRNDASAAEEWKPFWRCMLPLALLLVLASVGFTITALGIDVRIY